MAGVCARHDVVRPASARGQGRKGSDGLAVAQRAVRLASAPPDHPHHETTRTKRTTGATDGPKSLKGFSLAIALPCDASSLHAYWQAAAGVDSRFTLAV